MPPECSESAILKGTRSIDRPFGTLDRPAATEPAVFQEVMGSPPLGIQRTGPAILEAPNLSTIP